jgi:hypothetical protein
LANSGGLGAPDRLCYSHLMAPGKRIRGPFLLLLALTALLAPLRAAAEDPAAGDFEGTSIGGKTVFSTDPDINKGILNRFIFDDPALSHGRFVRPSGGTVTVAREKK